MFSPTQRPTTACRWFTLWQGQGASVCAQRSRLPFTAMPSRPHGARSATICTSLQSLHRSRYASRAGQRACNRSQGLPVRPRPSCAVFALRCKRARASRFHLDLCHGLCHNLAIPAGVGPSLAVSLTYTRKAVNVRETRMNTALPCRSVSLGSLPYQ